jgi:3-isopropylmalate dehydrogenase
MTNAGRDKGMHRIAVVPGDGIGPEVIAEAEKVLRTVADRFGLRLIMEQGLIGAAAMDATGDPLPEATLSLCRASDAILLGAVGDPRYPSPGCARSRHCSGCAKNSASLPTCGPCVLNRH